jgi:TRAP-type C4-dicarboxylate transport system permease small subunit
MRRAESGDLRPMIARALVALPRLIVGTLFLLSLLLNFANVIARYLFSSPIMSAEEILTYSMIWCIFLGAVLVTWEGRHLRMDLVFIVCSPGLRRWLSLVGLVVFMAVCLTVALASIEVVTLVSRNGERSVVAEIPMVVPYIVLPLGFGLMSVAVMLRFRALVQADEAGRTEIIEALEEQNRTAA